MHNESIKPEEMLKLVSINKLKKIKVTAELQDDEKVVTDLGKTIEGITKYINSKLTSNDENQLIDQIMPLMTQAMIGSLGRTIGVDNTACLMTVDTIRDGILYAMCTSFLLLKFIQKHDLKVFTHIEHLTDKEIKDMEMQAQINKIATFGAMTGLNPQEIIDELLKTGQIDEADIEKKLKKN